MTDPNVLVDFYAAVGSRQPQDVPEHPTLPSGTIRQHPEDFVVDEIPAYEPAGEGEHLFLKIQKRNWTTPAAASVIEKALGLPRNSASHAGLKDRHAVTTQWLSVPFPIKRSVGEVEQLDLPEGIVVMETRRHGNKLKPGHLRGNRFSLTVRDIDPQRLSAVADALRHVGRVGIPNAFGTQRFGRDGDNATEAFAWISGQAKPPRDRRKQRLLFSAWQSSLFNEVLLERISDGTWHQAQAGDLAKKHENGALFDVESTPEAVAEATTRAQQGLISPTGPIFGCKMRAPHGAPAALEEAVLARHLPDAAATLARHKALGEGSRRALRVMPTELLVEPRDGSEPSLWISFVLPKGSYATTLLACVCRVLDASSPASMAPARGAEEAS